MTPRPGSPARSADSVSRLIDHLFRHQYGRLVAGLTRVFGPDRLDLVEDVVQDAMVRAMKAWQFGLPEEPEAWLVRVARNLALDALRRRAMTAKKGAELATWAAAASAPAGAVAVDESVPDDALRMIFTCCHPALSAESRVALTLKTLCGLGVREIAAALLAREATVAQRLTRAKAQLQRSNVAFEVPGPSELEPRLNSVLEVVYLAFNEGYAAHSGEALVRRELVQESLRLGELLVEMPMTRLPKVHALLALMLFLGARLPARTGAGGELVTLAEQDRTLWNRRWIDRAFGHFERSIAGPELSAFHVEAAIASLHAAAPCYAATDWPAILARYDQLARISDSPVAALNRAVALAKVEGPAAGLAALAALDGEPALRGYHLLPATRGQLLWAHGDPARAAAELGAALALGCSEPERRLLRARIDSCRRGEPAPEF